LIKFLYKSGITEIRIFRQSDREVKSLFYYQRHFIRPAEGLITQSASQTRGDHFGHAHEFDALGFDDDHAVVWVVRAAEISLEFIVPKALPHNSVPIPELKGCQLAFWFCVKYKD